MTQISLKDWIETQTQKIWLSEYQRMVLDRLIAENFVIPMILHCPYCGVRHIDEVQPDVCVCGHDKAAHSMTLTDHPDYHDTSNACGECWMSTMRVEMRCREFVAWLNPPHHKHYCKPSEGGCGRTFEPAKINTNGVREL